MEIKRWGWVRLTAISVALLAASCTTLEDDTAVDETVAVDEIEIVPLSALPETPARPLSGRYVQTSWSNLPRWQSDDLTGFWHSFLRNCQGLMRPVSGNLSMPARAAPRQWQPVCAAALAPDSNVDADDSASIRQFLQTYLTPWRLDTAAGTPAQGTVTGYYEPVVQGSRTRQGAYQWPLYAVPENLLNIDLGGLYPELAGKRIRGKVVDGNRVVPYDSRSQISDSDEQPPAIVWVNDPVDNFFLQIQGSGRVHLAEGPNAGQTIRLAYANHNGHPYRSIGRWLADQGELPLSQASMQNIRAWARDNPDRVHEMLNANPAVVFFREEAIAGDEGPKGAYGIPLSPKRAIAVDPTFVPLGTPIYLTTTMPASQEPLERLVLAQDTGAAIKGAARADFFWGPGEEAGALAGRMKQRGQMWLLWPKAAGEPSAR